MSICRRFAFITALATVILSGCCSHTDLTHRADVQSSGILGQRFRTTQDLELIKDKHTDTLRLMTKDHSSCPRFKQIGKIEAGTQIEVNHVINVKELVAILIVLPEYWAWKCTLAKVEDGPYAGKEIAVAGEGILMLDNEKTARLGSALLKPVKPSPPAAEQPK